MEEKRVHVSGLETKMKFDNKELKNLESFVTNAKSDSDSLVKRFSKPDADVKTIQETSITNGRVNLKNISDKLTTVISVLKGIQTSSANLLDYTKKSNPIDERVLEINEKKDQLQKLETIRIDAIRKGGIEDLRTMFNDNSEVIELLNSTGIQDRKQLLKAINTMRDDLGDKVDRDRVNQNAYSELQKNMQEDISRLSKERKQNLGILDTIKNQFAENLSFIERDKKLQQQIDEKRAGEIKRSRVLVAAGVGALKGLPASALLTTLAMSAGVGGAGILASVALPALFMAFKDANRSSLKFNKTLSEFKESAVVQMFSGKSFSQRVAERLQVKDEEQQMSLAKKLTVTMNALNQLSRSAVQTPNYKMMTPQDKMIALTERLVDISRFQLEYLITISTGLNFKNPFRNLPVKQVGLGSRWVAMFESVPLLVGSIKAMVGTMKLSFKMMNSIVNTQELLFGKKTDAPGVLDHILSPIKTAKHYASNIKTGISDFFKYSTDPSKALEKYKKSDSEVKFDLENQIFLDIKYNTAMTVAKLESAVEILKLQYKMMFNEEVNVEERNVEREIIDRGVIRTEKEHKIFKEMEKTAIIGELEKSRGFLSKIPLMTHSKDDVLQEGYDSVMNNNTLTEDQKKYRDMVKNDNVDKRLKDDKIEAIIGKFFKFNMFESKEQKEERRRKYWGHSEDDYKNEVDEGFAGSSSILEQNNPVKRTVKDEEYYENERLKLEEQMNDELMNEFERAVREGGETLREFEEKAREHQSKLSEVRSKYEKDKETRATRSKANPLDYYVKTFDFYEKTLESNEKNFNIFNNLLSNSDLSLDRMDDQYVLTHTFYSYMRDRLDDSLIGFTKSEVSAYLNTLSHNVYLGLNRFPSQSAANDSSSGIIGSGSPAANDGTEPVPLAAYTGGSGQLMYNEHYVPNQTHPNSFEIAHFEQGGVGSVKYEVQSNANSKITLTELFSETVDKLVNEFIIKFNTSKFVEKLDNINKTLSNDLGSKLSNITKSLESVKTDGIIAVQNENPETFKHTSVTDIKNHARETLEKQRQHRLEEKREENDDLTAENTSELVETSREQRDLLEGLMKRLSDARPNQEQEKQKPSMLGKATGLVGKAGIVGAMGYGIYQLLTDTINGFMEGLNAEDGGIGKAVWGAVKGMFSVDSSQTASGIMKNMGKYAVIGAGIATLIPIPIVNWVVGGVLGAAIGGILSFVDQATLKEVGEKIEGFGGMIWDKVKGIGKSVEDVYYIVRGSLTDAIEWTVNKSVEIYEGISGFMKTTWDSISQTYMNVRGFVSETIENTVNGTVKIFTDSVGWVTDKYNTIKTNISDSIGWVVDTSTTIFSGVTGLITDTWTSISTTFADVKTTVSDTFVGIGTWINEKIDVFKNFEMPDFDPTKIISNLFHGVRLIFNKLTGIFNNINFEEIELGIFDTIVGENNDSIFATAIKKVWNPRQRQDNRLMIEKFVDEGTNRGYIQKDVLNDEQTLNKKLQNTMTQEASIFGGYKEVVIPGKEKEREILLFEQETRNKSTQNIVDELSKLQTQIDSKSIPINDVETATKKRDILAGVFASRTKQVTGDQVVTGTPKQPLMLPPEATGVYLKDSGTPKLPGQIDIFGEKQPETFVPTSMIPKLPEQTQQPKQKSILEQLPTESAADAGLAKETKDSTIKPDVLPPKETKPDAEKKSKYTSYKGLRLKHTDGSIITDGRSGQAISGGPAHPGTIALGHKIQEFMDKNHPGLFNRFTAFRDAYHENKSYKNRNIHKEGLGIDATIKEESQSKLFEQIIKKIGKEYGTNVSTLNEYIAHTKYKTAPHMHINFKNDADANTFLKNVTGQGAEQIDKRLETEGVVGIDGPGEMKGGGDIPPIPPKGKKSYTKAEVQAIVVNIADKYPDISRELMWSMGQIESGFDHKVKNKFGFAGVYQFGTSTKSGRPTIAESYGLKGDDVYDPFKNAEAAITMMRENRAYVHARGLPKEDWVDYLAHQQGRGGAETVWKTANGIKHNKKLNRTNILANVGSKRAEFSKLSDKDLATEFLKLWKSKYEKVSAKYPFGKSSGSTKSSSSPITTATESDKKDSSQKSGEQSILETATGTIAGLGSSAMSMGSSAMDSVSSGMSSVYDSVSSGLTGIGGPDLGAMGDSISGAASDAMDFGSGMMDEIMGGMGDLFGGDVGEMFKSSMQTVMDVGKTAYGKSKEGLTALNDWAMSGSKEVNDNLMQGVREINPGFDSQVANFMKNDVKQLTLGGVEANTRSMGDLASSAWETTKGIGNDIKEGASNIWNGETATKMKEGTSDIIDSGSSAISSGMSSVSEATKGIFDNEATSSISKTVSDGFSSLGSEMNGLFGGESSIGDSVKDVGSSISSGISSIGDSAKSLFKDTSLSQHLPSKSQNIGDSVSDSFKSITSGISGTIDSGVDSFKKPLSDITNQLGGFISEGKNKVSNIFGSVEKSVNGTTSGIFDSINKTKNDVFGNIRGTIDGTLNKVSSSISGGISGVTDKVSESTGDLFGSIDGLTKDSKSGISGIFDSVKNTVSSTAGKLKKSGNDFLNSKSLVDSDIREKMESQVERYNEFREDSPVPQAPLQTETNTKIQSLESVKDGKDTSVTDPVVLTLFSLVDSAFLMRAEAYAFGNEGFPVLDSQTLGI
jgi:hypothetical protein